MTTPDERAEKLLAMRDTKAKDHLRQYAPLWLVDEKLILDEDAVQFNVVFMHPRYGWVNRRYRYDAFSDVLYQKGQNLIDEEEALVVQQADSYLLAPTINSVDSYGG